MPAHRRHSWHSNLSYMRWVRRQAGSYNSINQNYGGRWGVTHWKQQKGYLYIYLGVDHNSKPVTESVHRLITLAAHGAKGANQEVSHACCNPWCLSPRCMSWATHQENQQTPRPARTWPAAPAAAAAAAAAPAGGVAPAAGPAGAG